MYNAYPFVTALDKSRLEPFTEAPRPANRMDVQRHHQEYKRMNTLAYGYEEQVQRINDQRQQDAMHDEQVRLARGDRPSRLTAIARSVRASLGGVFIAAGERIRPEPLPRPELDAKPVERVRHA
jgi:hypothetical protein